ncbi:MAG: hypothetical protein U0935_23315 [Pirellulales bacterium]
MPGMIVDCSAVQHLWVRTLDRGAIHDDDDDDFDDDHLALANKTLSQGGAAESPRERRRFDQDKT